MPIESSFDYAVLRIVPRVDREEFLNSGVILFCLQRKFLKAQVEIHKQRIEALWPGLDIDEAAAQLGAISRICAGDRHSGPIALMPLRERFQWLVAPRSTVIQVSAVHTGLTADPETTLRLLHQSLVMCP